MVMQRTIRIGNVLSEPRERDRDIQTFASTGVCEAGLAELIDSDAACQAAVEDAFVRRLQRVGEAVLLLRSGSV